MDEELKDVEETADELQEVSEEVNELEKEAIKNIKYVGFREDIPLELIDPNPWNPVQMDSKDFDLLVKNIESMGFITTVELRQKDGRFEIINGEHRFLALKKLGRETVRGTIFECTDNEAKIMCLMLNRIKGRFHTAKLGKLLFDLQSEFKIGQLLNVTGYSETTYRSISSLMDIPEAKLMDSANNVFNSDERLEPEEERIERLEIRKKDDFKSKPINEFNNILFTVSLKKEQYESLVEVLKEINPKDLSDGLSELVRVYKENKNGTIATA